MAVYLTMKRDSHDDLRSVGRRNESDMRMIGGIVGVCVGGFVGLYLDARVLRYMIHLPPWALVAGLVIAATIGGIVGYFQDTWRSSL